jgi:ribonuclease R
VDARDHDDAVYAHPTTDANNVGGWVVWVAIADVAAYVRPGSALDARPARRATASTSPTGWSRCCPSGCPTACARLREGENRACLAVRMVFDKSGRKTGHRFVRGLMRSAAKLSYEQAQAAADGQPDDKTGPLLEPSSRPCGPPTDDEEGPRRPLAPGHRKRRAQDRHQREGEVTSITPRPASKPTS